MFGTRQKCRLQIQRRNALAWIILHHSLIAEIQWPITSVVKFIIFTRQVYYNKGTLYKSQTKFKHMLSIKDKKLLVRVRCRIPAILHS